MGASAMPPAFGGDPSNVTLGGQSAGAGATAANVFSPGAKGLFHRAIFQSGGYTPFVPKSVAEDKGKKFAAAAGCTPKNERTATSPNACAPCPPPRSRPWPAPPARPAP